MLLIKGAKIYPVIGPVLNPGMLLVDDQGKIVAISEQIEAPAGAQVLDCTGKVILPGLIDVHTHVGMWGDGEGHDAYDGNEMPDPVNAKVSALDAINPFQRSFEGAREGGITTVQIMPGSGNPVGGLALACKTAGTIIDEMVVKYPTGLKGALGENPKKVHGTHFKHTPSTRMGTAALIRDYFEQVKQYAAKKKEADAKGDSFELNLNLEPGLQVLNGEMPFRVHAHRHDDIVTVVRLCEELGIPYSVEHCTDGHLIAEFLGKKGITAHVGPGLSAPSKVETMQFTDRNPAILAAQGVKVCLMTDHPFLNCRYFMVYGAVAHKYGLSFEDTLKAMTINPAESIGIADRVGSLEPGKDADFIILNGEPFTYKSVIEQTYIEGKLVWERPVF